MVCGYFYLNKPMEIFWEVRAKIKTKENLDVKVLFFVVQEMISKHFLLAYCKMDSRKIFGERCEVYV